MLPGLKRGNAGWRTLVALLVACGGVVATLALGNWQTHRAAAKLALQAGWDAALAAPLHALVAGDLASGALRPPARVLVHGHFRYADTVWLDNRAQDGRAGFWVVTPLDVAGGGLLLVNRGWVARDPHERTRLPAIGEPAGEVVLEGLVLAQLPRRFALGAGPAGPLPAIWQNLDFDVYERISGLRVARLVLLQTGPDADGLARDWPRPDYGVATHRGYAVQWYAAAALIVVLMFIHGVKPWLARLGVSMRSRR